MMLHSLLNIQKSNFQNSFANESGGAIQAQSFRKSQLEQYAEAGGAITCTDCKQFYAKILRIFNSSAQSGGGLYLAQTDGIKNKYLKDNVLQQYIITFKNNIFASNYAQKNGGGIFTDLSFSGFQNFTSNQANNSGGAIFWNDVQPIMNQEAQMIFQNNKARIYANNIASYPQKLIKISEEQYNKQLQRVIDQDQRRLLANDELVSDQNNISQGHFRSGDSLPQMYLALADKYGQIVGTQNDQKLQISIIGRKLNATSQTQDMYSPVITGKTTFYSENGVYKLEGVQFTGSPGYSYELSFLSDGIDKNKPNNKDTQKLNDSSQQQIQNDFLVEIKLRECSIGERFTESGACDPCPVGKSFSLVKMTEPGQCRTCPSSVAICRGGSDIGESLNQKIIHKAHVKLGIKEYSAQIANQDIHRQILNAQNVLNRLKTSQDQQQYLYNTLFLTLIKQIGVIVGVVILIRVTLNGAGDVRNITSVYQKILLNHIQLILLTSTFNFKWPDIVMEFFKTSRTVGEASDQIFSVDCFLNSKEQSSQQMKQNNQQFFIRIFYFKLALFALMPFMLLILCNIIWMIILRKPRQKAIRNTKSVSSMVILLFLIHPNLIKFVFNTFNCVDIDGETRVKNDLEIECYRGQHFFWALAVALPAMIVWGLGIPFFGLALLLRNKKQLDQIVTRQKLGFLFRGYKRKYYYWEIVIMYRKIFLIFIQVFLLQYGVITQAMVVLILLIGFMALNLTLRPFQTISLNDLETLSVVTSLTTIYCGIFFIVSINNIDGSQETSQDSFQSFFTFWLYKMIREIKNMMIKKFGKLYTIICLCGNQQKYKQILEDAVIEEDNDILREKFSESLKQIDQLCDSGEIVLNKKSLEKLQLYLSKSKILDAGGILAKVQNDPNKQKRSTRIKSSAHQKLNEQDQAIIKERENIQIDDELEVDINFSDNQLDRSFDQFLSNNKSRNYPHEYFINIQKSANQSRFYTDQSDHKHLDKFGQLDLLNTDADFKLKRYIKQSMTPSHKQRGVKLHAIKDKISSKIIPNSDLSQELKISFDDSLTNIIYNPSKPQTIIQSARMLSYQDLENLLEQESIDNKKQQAEVSIGQQIENQYLSIFKKISERQSIQILNKHTNITTNASSRFHKNKITHKKKKLRGQSANIQKLDQVERTNVNNKNDEGDRDKYLLVNKYQPNLRNKDLLVQALEEEKSGTLNWETVGTINIDQLVSQDTLITNNDFS
ncbi:UNKNOWN [Stylonychia lemnae]|uniref:Transmembrane protein n=1 Tax=Stylonychia lemnae TaxID=5949 RepID=A0A078AWE6_STYLE|nr:UNKNOWN [Stylonychia lemnae]|eukprot:CDW85128.1 UNKNOWN [Stylonychia lemnae]